MEEEVDVGIGTPGLTVPVLRGGTAIRVGFGTPLGFIFIFFAAELMPDMASHPKVSQYRPFSLSAFVMNMEVLSSLTRL